MAKAGVASPERLLADFRAIGGRVIACEMTMEIMGIAKQDLDESLIKLVTAQGFVKPPFAAFTARAGDLYLPIPFAKSCKVTMTDKPFYHIINYNTHIRFKGFGMNKSIAHIKEDGIFFEMRHFGKDLGHCNHVCSIKHKSACVTMIGMIVVRPMAHHDVRAPLADQADDGLSVFQCGQQLAIVNIEDLRLDAEDDQSAAFREMLDRSAEYAELLADLMHFDPLAENAVTANKTLKALRRRYETLVEQDYFPGAGKLEAEARLQTLETTLSTRLFPNEPHFQDGQPGRLDPADFQKQTWATRQDLWVDRLASAWLIRRFIDRRARFVWLERVEDCPANALGFDFDGARFTHIGHCVTFETLLASFGLESDAALMRIGAIVHALDVGGEAPEAAGFETLLKGLKTRIQDDDVLLKQGGQMLDDLYAVFSNT